jgi:hypothetical protein
VRQSATEGEGEDGTKEGGSVKTTLAEAPAAVTWDPDVASGCEQLGSHPSILTSRSRENTVPPHANAREMNAQTRGHVSQPNRRLSNFV